MRFSDVIGQKELKSSLTEMAISNRLPHALLFMGKEGAGGLALALAFSQYLLCQRVFDNGQPALFGDPAPKPPDSCGECSSCLKSKKFVHPDIHYSFPVITKKSGTPPLSADYIEEWREFLDSSPYGNAYDWLQSINAENKQGNITAAECNDIFRKLSLKSFEGSLKILIMWMPEYLGKEGNKLLKILEEPPSNTLFILVAEDETQILPTILSRCQFIRIPALEVAQIEAALVNDNQLSEKQARQVAAISDGNYREAIHALQHGNEDWNTLLRDWLNAILKTGPVAQTKWVEEISRLGREKQKQFLRYFGHLLEQAVRHSIVDMKTNELPEAERSFVEKLNKLCDLGQLEAMVDELSRSSYYIERNANSKILFHSLTIRLYHIIQDKIVFLNA